jgi:hypothetical protein
MRVADEANVRTPDGIRYLFLGGWHFSDALEDAPGRRERLPAHAPLRTVRESFPSHGSSLSKNILSVGCSATR